MAIVSSVPHATALVSHASVSTALVSTLHCLAIIYLLTLALVSLLFILYITFRETYDVLQIIRSFMELRIFQ